MSRSIGRCFLTALFLIEGVALPGCMSRKPVYIPPEWQAAPPPPVGVPPAAPTQPPGNVGPASTTTGTPVLKAPPAFKEKDLPAGSELPVEKKQPPAPQPQHLASMHLVEKAKGSLSQKKPDQAIPVLEEAVQVDVHNGEAFYGLARAWRMKGSRHKALEFSKKAELLFQEDPVRLKEVYLFQADLYKEMGDAAKRDSCLKKASKLGGAPR